MKQKTAIDWLVEQIQNNINHTIRIPGEYVEQAKEMQKKQMIDFYVKGCNDTYGIDEPNEDPNYDKNEGEHYYNKIYLENK